VFVACIPQRDRPGGCFEDSNVELDAGRGVEAHRLATPGCDVGPPFEPFVVSPKRSPEPGEGVAQGGAPLLALGPEKLAELLTAVHAALSGEIEEQSLLTARAKL
jgi:hypothetical protein